MVAGKFLSLSWINNCFNIKIKQCYLLYSRVKVILLSYVLQPKMKPLLMNFSFKLFVLSSLPLLSLYSEAAKMTPGKVRVISELQSLMNTTPIATKTIKSHIPDTPYLQIIESTEGKSSLIYRCRNTGSRSIVDILENISSRSGRVEESRDENMIFFHDTNAKVAEAQKIILALDVSTPQILVEAKVIEVYTNNNKEKEFSFDYNKGEVWSPATQLGTMKFPASGGQPDVLDFSPFSLGINGSINRFHFFLKWLTTTNDAKILSSPNLMVALGATASIVTGDDLPIQSTSTTGSTVNTDVKYRRTGIQLFVTPTRINSNTVKLQVSPEVSTVTKYETLGSDENQTSVPVISVRNVKTELTCENGEVIMLGGLYSSETLKTVKKVPYLGDIPYLGWFFTSTSDSTVLKQLIFFLKVTILDSSSGALVDIGHNAMVLQEAGEILEASEAIFPKVQVEDDEKN